MNKPQKVFVAFLIILQITIFFPNISKAQNSNPSYPPFSKKCSNSEIQKYTQDFSQSEFARLALPICGSAAVPALITFLKHKNSTIKYAAIEGLRTIGPDAVDAIPKLIEILKEEGESSHKSKHTLARIGAASVPALIKLLSDEDKITRMGAAITLGWIGKDAEASVPFLIEALNQQVNFEYYYEFIASALGEIGQDAEIAVPALIELYRKRRTEVAIEALGKFGSSAKAAIPELIETLKNPQSVYSIYYTTHALGRIGKDSVPALVEALKNENDDIRVRAALAFVLIGSDAKSAARDLWLATKDKNLRVRTRAAVALSQVNPAYTKAVLSKLISALDDVGDADAGNSEMQVRVVKLLNTIGKDAMSAVPALMDVIKSCNDSCFYTEVVEVCRNAVTTLGNMGRSARKSIPSLIKVLEIEPRLWNTELRVEAALALGKIGEEADISVPALTKALGYKDKIIRINAYRALKQFSINMQSLISKLVVALSDKNEATRRQAALALATISQQAIPILIEALDDKDLIIRKGAAYALGNVDNSPKEVIDKLKVIIYNQKNELDLRRIAASSLELLGQDTQSFFNQFNLTNSKNAVCPSIDIKGGNYAFFDFDEYTGKCNYYGESCLNAPGEGVIKSLCRIFGC